MPSQRVVLASLAEPYLENRRPHLAASGLVQERRYLKRFFEFLKGQQVDELGAVDEGHVARYLLELRGLPGRHSERLSDSFFQQALLTVRSFLVWARKSGLLLWDFGKLPIPKRLDKPRRVPTEDEMRRLLELPDPRGPLGLRDRLIIELLYVLGLRLSECAGIDLHSIDLVARTVTVLGKGGHQRLLPLSPKLYETLLRYLDKSRPLLSKSAEERALLLGSITGRRLSKQSIFVRVRDYGRQLGIALHPHQLRHACATHLLEGGADPVYIAQLLGHKRLDSTTRYARARCKELAREHRRCHPRGVLGD